MKNEFTMSRFTLLVIGLCFSMVNGQTCSGRYNPNLVGYCEIDSRCQGTALTIERCEGKRCCFNSTATFPSPAGCLNPQVFASVYNSTRGRFLAQAFGYGFNQAGICSNCQAKAAFLAIAATMTDNFQRDEAEGEPPAFAADDSLYGNQEAGDGSFYRRRGFFGLRGQTMYERAEFRVSGYQLLAKPENAAISKVAIDIAVKIWLSPDLHADTPLTPLADGTFYGFSTLWSRLNGDMDKLAVAAQHYSRFLRLLECGGDLYPGQGGSCQYNATHNGSCIPACIQGLEESGDWCGCSGDFGAQCTGEPAHIRCCLGSCSQELKMDLGLVLDASGSIGEPDYQKQVRFVQDLLGRVNVGLNKTHVAIVKFSTAVNTLTSLSTDYELDQKIRKLRQAPYTGGSTQTDLALREASRLFTPENGLRPSEDGASQVIFVLTDGESANREETLAAASVLKNKSIHLVSVGIGRNLDLIELNGMCTPPSSENYFPINNYGALETKLNQFMSKTCTEPAIIPGNTTVVTEVGKDKYKFFKLQIIFTGKKLMIKVKLFNGKVKLFFSFKGRNPKDPAEFINLKPKSFLSDLTDRLYLKTSSFKANDEFVTQVIDRPADLDTDVVFVGIKGVEEENKFEVKLEDCQQVKCSSMAMLTTKFLPLLVLCSFLFRKLFE